VIHSATDIGGNSATTTIRPAPHRGQTRVGATVVSWPGGVSGSGSDGAEVGAGLKQVSRETVPQRMHMNVIARARGL
jgi:hypothetical protein